MKIVFIHTGDIKDKNIWSGTVYYLYHNLINKFDKVIYFQPKVKDQILLKGILKLTSYLSGKLTFRQTFNLYSDYFYPKLLSKSVDKFILENPADCIISTTNIPFIFTKNKVPIVIISDATVKLLYDEYSKGKGWSKLFYRVTDNNAIRVTRKAILIVTSSRSTTDSLIEDYDIYAEKIATIPFGANIEDESIQSVLRIITRDKPVNLLFIGKDWERKGGEFSVSVCDELIKQSINICLFVVGCKVPEQSQRPYITNFVYLDKNKKNDYDKLNALFSIANFFMVFSKAEMYGIVFCEAAAYGLPAISFAVGGINDIIVNDKTGIILPKGTEPEVFAKKINELIDDPVRYKEMSDNARRRYEELLNWDAFTSSLKKEIELRIN